MVQVSTQCKIERDGPVTGTVAATTAIGTLEASMLASATTSNITNSMNVPDSSSTPSG